MESAAAARAYLFIMAALEHNRKMIRAVFFDLDETLLDDERTAQRALALTCAAIQTSHPLIDPAALADAYIASNLAFWTNYDQRAEMRTGDELCHVFWTQALERFGIDDSDLAENLRLTQVRSRATTYALFPDAEPCLNALHGRYALGIISNGATSLQLPKVEALGLRRWMETVIVAEQAGVSKPDPAIFEPALKAVGCCPAEAVMVGDLLERDVEGARRAGLVPVWLDRPPEPDWDHPIRQVNRLCGVRPPEHVIHGLDELPTLLATL